MRHRSRPKPGKRPSRRPGYAPAVVRAVQAAAPLIRPGRVYTVAVAHDPDCRRPDGAPCTCNPEVGIPIPLEV